jgi:hypothetical protein
VRDSGVVGHHAASLLLESGVIEGGELERQLAEAVECDRQDVNELDEPVNGVATGFPPGERL